MSRRTYALTGEHASPEKFQEYLLQTAPFGVALRLTARRIDSDELSSRRQEAPEEICFKIHVENLTSVGSIPWFAEGRPFGLADTPWLQLEVKETSVEFDILS